MDITLVGVAAFGIAVLLMFWGLARILASQSVELDSRLGANYGLDGSADEIYTGAKGKSKRFNRLVSTSTRARIAAQLARADLKLTPGEYVMAQILATVAGLALGYFVFRGNLLFAAVLGAVGLYLPRWYVKHRQRKRIAAFNAQLPDAIVLMANSLRAGYSFLQSMETVSQQVQLPMSVEFRRVVREVNLGLTMEEALDGMAQRVPSDDLDMVITAIDIQNQVGGNLAEILDIIAHTIRERVRIMGEIRTITAQQRLSANVLSVLPLLLGLVIYAMSPTYVSLLWQTQCGLLMVGVGALLMVSGYFIIRRIAAIQV